MSSTAFQYENVYPREIEIGWKLVQNQDLTMNGHFLIQNSKRVVYQNHFIII